jgi:hypothetical protein
MAIRAMIAAAENRYIFRGFYELCLSDCPASDCADQPFVGPGFRTRAAICESVGYPLKGNSQFGISR